jgi:hypothetical protein
VPPGGYLPGAGYPPPEQYPGARPQRSAIPKVMGILMIVFAGIGLLGTVVDLVREPSFDRIPAKVVEEFRTFSQISQLTGLVVSLVHLVAGILCVMYRRVGRLLANVYGVLATIRVIVVMTLLYGWLAPIFDRLPLGVGETAKSYIFAAIVVASVLSLAWPVLIFVLMNVKGARAACVE